MFLSFLIVPLLQPPVYKYFYLAMSENIFVVIYITFEARNMGYIIDCCVLSLALGVQSPLS